MLVSQKCQYALRASFELARRWGQGPVKIGLIAQVQAIPIRFLEVILNQLKRGGFVASQRGSDGGYFLVKEPATLTVGMLIRFVQGPIGPIDCVADPEQEDCPLYGGCALLSDVGPCSTGGRGCLRPYNARRPRRAGPAKEERAR